MKDDSAAVELVTEGVEDQAYFGIDQEDVVPIIQILRDTIYTKRPLAVLREYGSNARESHIMSGCPGRPIRVTLPTLKDMTLKIRDFGSGLTDNDVLRVFTKFGKSTKRHTNDVAGHLGIGCKAGHCYSEQFTVISWHGGFRRIYIASLDPTGAGVMQRLDESPSDEETGVEIQVPIKPKDMVEFHTEARRLFMYYDPLPEINIDLPQRDRQRLKNGYIVLDSSTDGWVAVMGSIPYKVDLSELESNGGTSLSRFKRISGALYFAIGEVDHSASREEMKYTEKTRDAIERRATELLDEYATQAFRSLKDPNRKDTPPWEMRQQVRFLRHELGVAMPDEVAPWAQDAVPITGTTFKVEHEHRASGFVYVFGNSELIIVDDKRPLRGFHGISGHAHLVKPLGDATVDQVREELDKVLAAANLTGIPVKLISSFPWFPVTSGYGRTPNQKHKVQTFVLRMGCNCEYPYSANWDIVTREPQNDDVFVILSAFEAAPGQDLHGGFYSTYREDQMLVKVLGGTMPPIYGYKTTERKPVQVGGCQGEPYSKWRARYIPSLLTQKHHMLLVEYQWADVISWPWSRREIGVRKESKETLGANHTVSEFLDRHFQATTTVDSHSPRSGGLTRDILGKLNHLIKPGKNPAKEARRVLYERYPLLGIKDVGGFTALADEDCRSRWYEYIKLVDRDRAAQNTTPQA